MKLLSLLWLAATAFRHKMHVPHHVVSKNIAPLISLPEDNYEKIIPFEFDSNQDNKELQANFY